MTSKEKCGRKRTTPTLVVDRTYVLKVGEMFASIILVSPLFCYCILEMRKLPQIPRYSHCGFAQVWHSHSLGKFAELPDGIAYILIPLLVQFHNFCIVCLALLSPQITSEFLILLYSSCAWAIASLYTCFIWDNVLSYSSFSCSSV